MGEELADEGDQVGAAVATAQTKIISQVGQDCITVYMWEVGGCEFELGESRC